MPTEEPIKIDRTGSCGQRHVNLPVKATLGKRVVHSISEGHECKFEATICPSVFGLEANCWLGDKEGRTLALQMTGKSLLALSQALNEAIAEMKKYFPDSDLFKTAE